MSDFQYLEIKPADEKVDKPYMKGDYEIEKLFQLKRIADALEEIAKNGGIE